MVQLYSRVSRSLALPISTMPRFIIPLADKLNSSIGGMPATFTRNSTATVVDFEGQLLTALINELRFPGARRVHNLLIYSSNFSNTSWVKQSVTINTNSEVAPDGTLTAHKMVSILGTSTGIYQIPTSYKININYFFSIYAKASGKDTFHLSWNGYGTTIFNLSTGEASGPGGIEDVGNGWYRCYTKSQTPHPGQGLMIRFLNTTGDGTSGIYLWNAQFEEVKGTQTLPSETIPTNVLSFPYYGAGVDGVKYFTTDRSGNSLSTNGVLIEPASTNLFLNSSSPVTQSITVVSGSSYTVSGTGSGSVVLSGAGTGTVTSSTPRTFTATSTSLTCTVTNMTTVQVELGPKTSYIPTTTVPMTRDADVLKYDVGSVITQGQGSLYCEFIYTYSTGFPKIFELYADAANAIIVRVHTTKVLGVYVVNGGVNSTILNTAYQLQDSTLYKVGLSYNNNDLRFYVNGALIGQVSSVTIPNLSTLAIGMTWLAASQLNGEIGNIKYFKEVLTPAEAIKLTTV